MAPLNLRSSHGNKKFSEFLEAVEKGIFVCVYLVTMVVVGTWTGGRNL